MLSNLFEQMKALKHYASLLLVALFVACDTPSNEGPINGGSIDTSCQSNEILYTSTDGYTIQPKALAGFGATIVNNTYQDNVGCIVFDGAVTALPTSAFESCSTLQSVKLPEGVVEIGDKAFMNCSKLTKITLPNSLTKIGNSAFTGCVMLEQITLGSNLASIGNYAFAACNSLQSVNLPESLTHIGEGAFGGNTTVDYPTKFKVVYKTTAATPIEIDEQVVSHTLKNGVGTIVFGKIVTKIDTWFQYNDQITEVTLPESVTTIAGSAFEGCYNLASINFPSGLTSIDNYAFKNCKLLTKAVVPQGVTELGYGAFQGCEALASATIELGVQKIGKYTFEGCTSLASLVIPESVVYIGDYAIPSITEVKLPKNFYINYTATEKISINNPQASGANYLFNHTFENGVGKVGFNAPVTQFGGSLFNGIKALTGVTFPESVTGAIGGYCFYNCSNLSSITLPECITEIGGDAFAGCSSLSSITIPESVTKIGYRAFQNCTSLAEIYCKPTTPPTLSNNSDDTYVFGNNAVGRMIYVPEGAVDAYRNANVWKYYQGFIAPIGASPIQLGDIITHNGAKGVVYYMDTQKIKIVSVDETDTHWLRITNSKVSGVHTLANSMSDGRDNCRVLTKMTDYYHPARDWCVEKGDGWFLPAVRELQEVCEQMEVINASLSANGYSTIHKNGYYWTSTDYGDADNAYVIDTYDGEYEACKKTYSRRTRAIAVF